MWTDAFSDKLCFANAIGIKEKASQGERGIEKRLENLVNQLTTVVAGACRSWL